MRTSWDHRFAPDCQLRIRDVIACPRRDQIPGIDGAPRTSSRILESSPGWPGVCSTTRLLYSSRVGSIVSTIPLKCNTLVNMAWARNTSGCGGTMGHSGSLFSSEKVTYSLMDVVRKTSLGVPYTLIR